MNKGFVVAESLDAVKARVEKILANADGAFFNACFNSARGTLPGGIYAQFGWMAKGDDTVLTIEARSASDIEKVYALLYSQEEAEAEVASEPEE